MLDAFQGATSFVLVTGFASVAGVGVIGPVVREVLDRGGQGRIILAIDRQGFNTVEVFEALLGLKEERGAQLSIGVVLEGAGLLHAKALFTRGPAGERLLVGSANLTRNALGTNHELGLLLQAPSADVQRAFHRFVTSIAPRSLDGPDARSFLEARGLLPARRAARQTPVVDPEALPLATVIHRLPALPPLDLPPEEHIASWVSQGYLVGRGRRSLDALVLRMPHEQLVRLGHLRPPQREILGIASHETRSMGYGVDLLPTIKADQLRRAARRVTLLMAQLTLHLPCFGHWMPESYWDIFLAARQRLQGAASLDPDGVRELAAEHRVYLDQGGLEQEVGQILRRLGELDLIVPDRGTAVREHLLSRFRSELRLRTPDVLASAIEFRTARQRWSPYEQTEVPYRQLLVDVVQGTFAATYRTGDWPRRFRSHAARHIAASVEERLLLAGQVADGEAATSLLDHASGWESSALPLAAVVDAFRALVGDRLTFTPPDTDTLAASVSETAEQEGQDDEL
jgi:hypothetical protein